ncbi:CapA family protein [Paenibacillus chitinolyticus]|uniref:CapA family protein n=1 Tax=Paenibacillus chitinolyticus TaxID=79263 RepID=UPI002DBCE402|nr:CapA family protein [Paenibacillus chitinolyticus]MEC0249109.1 CapA family protein [Paenibacillus chitinolyticus]
MKKQRLTLLIVSAIFSAVLVTGLLLVKIKMDAASVPPAASSSEQPAAKTSGDNQPASSAVPAPEKSPVPAASPVPDKAEEPAEAAASEPTGSKEAKPADKPAKPGEAKAAEKPKGSQDTAPAVRKKVGDHEAVDLIFAGDALMDWSVKETIKKKGPDYPFQFVKAEVSKADYAFVNLETSVTDATEKDTNQLYNFKSDPPSLKGLKNAGFDLVSIANNHVLDFGRQGFLDTLNHLKQTGLPYIGGGRNAAEAYKAKTVEIKGAKIKFLAFSRFIPSRDWFAGPDTPGIAQAYDKSAVLPVIRQESKDADYVFVYMHWGVEKNHKPEEWQRTFAKEMIDAGADGIIGSHVHVLQGFEFYKGKPIAYSIGNFLFPDYVRDAKADTGLLKLKLINGKITAEFNPYYIQKDQIVKRDAAYDKKQMDFLQSISYGVKIRGKAIEPAS